MLKEILAYTLHGKRMLDVGCGTGILSILAAKMGAAHIIAIDLDPNAVANCRENLMIRLIKSLIG